MATGQCSKRVILENGRVSELTPRPGQWWEEAFIIYQRNIWATNWSPDQENIARIVNAVHCHSKLSGYRDCHEFRFSIVSIVINVSNVTLTMLTNLLPKKLKPL